ncbi:MAG: hypothetical protein MJE77_00370 [Proteobacteria bacterium]|nr:hypothetical protein [Pseudomonadota bacterium]
MRIGERLIREEIITTDQLNEALSTQVLRGGRIGTNLVELGHMDIDTLAECLGRHHGMPVALEKHFEVAGRALQERLGTEVAMRWGVVPVGRVLGRTDQIAVAVMNPLPEQAVEEISRALGSELILAVAPELRLLYQLEKVFNIPRSHRFVRLPPEAMMPLIADPTEDEAQVDIQLHLDGEASDELDEVEIELDAPTTQLELGEIGDATARAGDGSFALSDNEVTRVVGAPGAGPPPLIPREPLSTTANDGQPERRHFVQTLSDTPLTESQERRLARIPIKRVSTSPGQSNVPPPPPAPVQSPSSLEGAFRAIRQATGRDRVGDLVVAAMHDFFDHVFEAGAILVVRDPIAIGWKGFVRGGSHDVIEAIALPLNTPSIVAEPYRQRKSYIGPPLAGGTQIDHRLWELLKSQPPRTVSVVPVLLRKQAVCMLYAHSYRSTKDVTAVVGDRLAGLAQCTTRAFARLIRAAQR